MSRNESVGVSSAAGVSRHSTLHAASVSVSSWPRCVEVEAFGVVLLALPAGADAEIEPALRQHVERRGLLREQRGGPQRRDEDAGREPHARR